MKMTKTPFNQTSPPALHGCTNRAVPILAGLVFLHALVSAPLLVQCIGADGRGLIEVLGNDPCHTLRVPSPTGSTTGPAAREFAKSDLGADPCRDLLLESPGCNSPNVETTPATVRATDSAAPAHNPGAAGTAPDPIREPGHPMLIRPGLHPRNIPILRI